MDTSRVLWTHAAAFMFSMVGSGVLECLGLARFGFVARIVLMWCLCVPTLIVFVLLSRDDPDMLPVMWVIFSAFEAVMAAVCPWRIRRAVAGGENRLHTDSPTPQPA